MEPTIDPRLVEMEDRSEELFMAIRYILAGEDPSVQGAAIAQMMAVFFAGHHPGMRAKARAQLMECARSLEPLVVEEFIALGKVGTEWFENNTNLN